MNKNLCDTSRILPFSDIFRYVVVDANRFFMWAKSKIGELSQIMGQKIWNFGTHIYCLSYNQILIQIFNKNLQKLSRSTWAIALVLTFSLFLTACGDRPPAASAIGKIKAANIAEVSPPEAIQKLNRLFDRYEPQLKILSPQADQVISDTNVAVQLEVKDLPIFKNAEFDAGSHVQVLLDNQAYKSSFDLSQPLVFDNLSVGTHTLRAFVLRPWNESFKNEGAYAQTTFHVFSKTGENTPSPQAPLLSYGYPIEQVGAEPVLLDFHLHNAPLHLAAIEDENITDWRIKATINEDQFDIDQWHPLYLKGLKVGKNLVKLELLDAKGNAIANQFNTTAHLIDYQPGAKDTLSKLFRNEAIAGIEAIIDPDYAETQAALAAKATTDMANSVASSLESSTKASISQSISQFASQSTSQSVSQSKSESLSQSTTQSIAQSITQSITQSVSQSISQSVTSLKAKLQSEAESQSQSQSQSQSKAQVEAQSQSASTSLSASISNSIQAASSLAKSEAIVGASIEAQAQIKKAKAAATQSTPTQSIQIQSIQPIPSTQSKGETPLKNRKAGAVNQATSSQFTNISKSIESINESIKSDLVKSNQAEPAKPVSAQPDSLSWFEKLTQKKPKSDLPAQSVAQPSQSLPSEIAKEVTESKPKAESAKATIKKPESTRENSPKRFKFLGRESISETAPQN
jgi:hypothetical protein